MHYPGIVSYSGMAVGRSGFPNQSAAPLRPAQEAARIGAVQAENRRHVRDLLVDGDPAANQPFGTEIVAQAEPGATFGAPRGGGMVLSFLAQHIAQELSPETASPDRFGSASNAYIGARDFNAEILPEGSGLDIRI